MDQNIKLSKNIKKDYVEDNHKILNKKLCIIRQEKSKYFTEEFFEKNPTKYKYLIEKYDTLEFNVITMYNMKNSEDENFIIYNLELENKTIEKTYNELLDFQEWLENSSKKIINEMKQEIKELELNLEDKWDENLENIQEEIIKIGNKIISEYGETITLDDIDSPISKKFELLSNIRDISWLIEDTKILEYIPLYSDNSIYDYEIGYSYILIKKETGCLYLLSGVQSNHRPTFEKIAENFDEFMERLYIADPIDFEDDNEYKEISRKIKENVDKKE